MKRYAIRAIKYFVFLTVLYILIFVVMSATGTLAMDFQTLKLMLQTNSGLLMLGLIVLLSAVHPIIGYTTREFTADTEGREETIFEVMKMLGFTVVSTNGDVTVFKAVGLFKKLNMLFEDEIEYDAVKKTLTGNRKQVTIAAYRIQSNLINKN
ncbi:MAG: hypothetical protein R3Y26_07705 [Rikenellaceae bacterium]